MEKENFSQLDAQALKEIVFNSKKSLFELKLQWAGAQTKDYSQFRKLRKRIAQANTQLRAQELKAEQEK